MAEGKDVFQFTDANFDENINGSEQLSIVDFWATWCGPCVMLGPVIEELAKKYADEKVTVGKLNVDVNPEVTARFGIRSIPAILFFKDDELVDTVVGVASLEVLEEKIRSHLE